MGEVRAAVGGYRDAGLARAVASAEQLLTAGGIAAHVEIDRVEMTPVEEAVLALAVREGVTNVVRHSRASSCSILLARDAGVRRLRIVDDGNWKRGLDGNGLAGMRERVEAIGGDLSIQHESGTMITIELRDTPPPRVAASDSSLAAVHNVA